MDHGINTRKGKHSDTGMKDNQAAKAYGRGHGQTDMVSCRLCPDINRLSDYCGAVARPEGSLRLPCSFGVSTRTFLGERAPDTGEP